MKTSLALVFTVVISAISAPVWSAEDEDSKSMQIEKIIAACEAQYTEEGVPDPEERNKLIDQCIDEQTAKIQS